TPLPPPLSLPDALPIYLVAMLTLFRNFSTSLFLSVTSCFTSSTSTVPEASPRNSTCLGLRQNTWLSLLPSPSPRITFTGPNSSRSEEHTSELQSRENLV